VRLVFALMLASFSLLYVTGARADTYTQVCDDPSTDINGHLCVVMAEHIEHGTTATETLDTDIQWVVFSVAFLGGFGACMYGLHALRRAAFGKTVMR
jgi:hypothetical protein